MSLISWTFGKTSQPEVQGSGDEMIKSGKNGFLLTALKDLQGSCVLFSRSLRSAAQNTGVFLVRTRIFSRLVVSGPGGTLVEQKLGEMSPEELNFLKIRNKRALTYILTLPK